MKQSINRLLYKLGSMRGFITAIVSAVGVVISGIWFRYGLMFYSAEAIPIIIFIGFILGGILLEVIVFRLINNGLFVIPPEANDAVDETNGATDVDADSDADAETNSETDADIEK